MTVPRTRTGGERRQEIERKRLVALDGFEHIAEDWPELDSLVVEDVPWLLATLTEAEQRAERYREALCEAEPLIDAQFEGHATSEEYMEKARKLNRALDVVRAATNS